MAEHDTFLFTSESVNEGHPDKLADQVRGHLPPTRSLFKKFKTALQCQPRGAGSDTHGARIAGL